MSADSADVLASLAIDDEGWCRGALRVPSPNCDARPDGALAELLIVHNISLPPGCFTGEAVAALFTNTLDHTAHPYYAGLRGLRVSAHFMVRRDGTLIQFVSCLARAWHAGVSRFGTRERCNDFSIGVELEGTDTLAFAVQQYRVLAALTRTLAEAYPVRFIAGHSDVAPGRKTDPGPGFDWERLLADPVLARLGLERYRAP